MAVQSIVLDLRHQSYERMLSICCGLSPVVTAGVNVVLDPVNLRVKGVCHRQQAFHDEIFRQSRSSSILKQWCQMKNPLASSHPEVALLLLVECDLVFPKSR